jgi:hypothetical protein
MDLVQAQDPQFPNSRPRHRRSLWSAGALAAGLLALAGVVFMTGSVASAATSGVTQPGSHTVAVTSARAAAPAASPEIKVEPCTSSRETWVHMTIKVGDQPARTVCYGYEGIAYFSANEVTYFCSGNNHGTLSYYTESGEAENLGFLAGYIDHPKNIDVVALDIKGYGGDDKC